MAGNYELSRFWLASEWWVVGISDVGFGDFMLIYNEQVNQFSEKDVKVTDFYNLARDLLMNIWHETEEREREMKIDPSASLYA